MTEKIDNINTRDYCLTCWIKDISQEELKSWLFVNFDTKILKYTIGNTEQTQQEKPHFHTYIKFKNPIRMTTLIKKLNIPSTHFEKMNTSTIKCHNYCIIESGCYDSNISKNLIVEESKDNDAYECLIKDIFENNFSMFEVCKKYGKIAILHFDNVVKVIQVRDKQEFVDFSFKVFDEELGLYDNNE